MALCLCEFCIHAAVRLSMSVPVHVYSSLPLEHFVQVGVRLSLYYWCMALAFCSSGCAIELVLLVHGSSVLFKWVCD